MPVTLTSAQAKRRILRGVYLGYDNEDDTTPGTNEVQQVALTGVPTGGTFTLAVNGAVTDAIAYNATAAVVQARLQALVTVQADNATVSGTAPTWNVTFAGELGSQDIPIMVGVSSLTGGTSPAVSITTTTPGAAGSRDLVRVLLDAAGVSFGPEINTVITQGTQLKYRDDLVTAETVTINQQVFERAWHDFLLASTTTGLPSGIAQRYHVTGTPLTTPCSVILQLESIAQSDGALIVEEVVYPHCTPRQYRPIQDAQAEAIVAQSIVLEATKSRVDLLNRLIRGADEYGDFAYIDVLS